MKFLKDLKHYFGAARKHVKSHGVVKTVRTAFAMMAARIGDEISERRYGVSTSQNIYLNDLDIDEELKKHAAFYAPTQYSILKSLLGRVDQARFGKAFVDYGCGRGRVLMVAARFGFLDLTGIELSASLSAYAKTVMAEVEQRYEVSTTILCVNATEYKVPATTSVLYFYNPFDETVMRPVIDNIMASLRENPRDMCVIYAHDLHGEIFIEHGFTPTYSLEQGGVRSRIYIRSSG